MTEDSQVIREAVQKRFDRLEEVARNASTPEESAAALDSLFSYWDDLLQEPSAPHAMHVFREAHTLLFDPVFRDRAWSWVRDKAATIVDADVRTALWIGVREPLPEEPVSWDALERLFCDWSLDPRTKWAVLDMYSSQPKLLRKHLKHFSAKCKAEGRQPPGISEDDVRQWLFELHGCVE